MEGGNPSPPAPEAEALEIKLVGNGVPEVVEERSPAAAAVLDSSIAPPIADIFSRTLPGGNGSASPAPPESSPPVQAATVTSGNKKQEGVLHTDLDMDVLLEKYPKPKSLENDAHGNNPEEAAGLFNFLFLSYLGPLIALGKKRPLLEQDVP